METFKGFMEMFKGTQKVFLAACIAAGFSAAASADYSTYDDAQALMDEMVAEHKFDRAELQVLFKSADKKQSILDAIARPAEKRLEWKDYRKIFVTESRTKKGVDFWAKHKDTLARAEKELGVPAEVIVAIIGVETRYGQHAGSYRVIDALSTLAFDYPKRAKFFRKELKQFLLLTQEQKQDPLTLKGSYAGAMGYGQFMPSSFRAYAIDFDGDGIADIWNNPVDAIGSVANYFKAHHWTYGDPVVTRTRVTANYDAELLSTNLKPTVSYGKLASSGYTALIPISDDTKVLPMRLEGVEGAEFWLGLHNFYVITRYNRSQMYSLAVHQLSQAIKVDADSINAKSAQKQY